MHKSALHMPMRRLPTAKRLANTLKGVIKTEEYNECSICLEDFDEGCEVSVIACSADK